MHPLLSKRRALPYREPENISIALTYPFEITGAYSDVVQTGERPILILRS